MLKFSFCFVFLCIGLLAWFSLMQNIVLCVNDGGSMLYSCSFWCWYIFHLKILVPAKHKIWIWNLDLAK